jgi:hypothetical protein
LVEIPGVGQDKVNATFANGGPELTRAASGGGYGWVVIKVILEVPALWEDRF